MKKIEKNSVLFSELNAEEAASVNGGLSDPIGSYIREIAGMLTTPNQYLNAEKQLDAYLRQFSNPNLEAQSSKFRSSGTPWRYNCSNCF